MSFVLFCRYWLRLGSLSSKSSILWNVLSHSESLLLRYSIPCCLFSFYIRPGDWLYRLHGRIFYNPNVSLLRHVYRPRLGGS